MAEKLTNWITAGTGTPFYARKTFTLPEKPAKAQIMICGLGQFNLFVNGKKISDHVLDPAWTDYRKLINFLTFDITEELEAGENVIAAEVGNGWFIMDHETGYSFHFPPFMPENPNPYIPYSSVLLLSAIVEMTDHEGDTWYIETNRSWKVHEHMVSHSNVYGSEIMDGTKRQPGWNTTDFDDSSWKTARFAMAPEIPEGEVVPQTIPAVRVIHVYDGKRIGKVNGRLIYDFSQNTSGMISLSLKGKKGDVVKIYPAEKLGPDGDVDQLAKNWINIDVLDTCILGTDDTFEDFNMTFTYVGCRYAAIEGAAEDCVKDVKLSAITSAVEDAGSFDCDDERYLKIYDLVKKAVEANLVSVHTDCPTIERFAWQEENHLMAPAIMYMKDVRLHWEKYLKDTRTAQHKKDDYFNGIDSEKYFPGEGLIPSQAPCYLPNVAPVPGLGEFYDIIGWGSSIVLGTLWHYRFYGDAQIIRDNYEEASLYITHMMRRVNDDGFINHGLGDWGNPVGEFARENVETAFLYADLDTMYSFAKLLGKKDDEEYFRRTANRVRENYNRKLLTVDPETGLHCYRVWAHPEKLVMTQAAEAMPLFFDIAPDDLRDEIAKSLRKSLETAGCIQSGEVGQPYIIQMATIYGMSDLISKFILEEKHPSYYAFVLDGETSLGEYWEENPRSHCHDMMGHIAEWYFNGIAGIRPLRPGFKRALVKPYMPESMNHFKAVYHSASGLISVEATRTADGIELKTESDGGIELVIDRTFLDKP